MLLNFFSQLTLADVHIGILNDNDHNPEFEQLSYEFSDVEWEEGALVGVIKVRQIRIEICIATMHQCNLVHSWTIYSNVSWSNYEQDFWIYFFGSGYKMRLFYQYSSLYPSYGPIKDSGLTKCSIGRETRGLFSLINVI